MIIGAELGEGDVIVTQCLGQLDDLILDFFRRAGGVPSALRFGERKVLRARSERIVDAQSGEAREVSVGRPEFSDTVFEYQCGDMRVVGKVAAGLAGPE